MLRMSKLTDYGTVILTYLASQPGRLHAASEIAEQIRVAPPTVSKVLKTLVRGGLVASHRGTKGGYALARPAERITVAQVLAVLEGPIGLTECSSNPGQCVQETSCSVRGNWQRINLAIRRALEDVTLAEMVQPMKPQTVRVAPPKPLRRASATT
ncbi:MAG: SUF system Fe-S cluster assembly regulator [Gammaproteobacteria bacterium]|nr:MAG: SUF system Fe-S cluster assembly regulator [Gammaproteobacteria bacterium]